jgi:NAD(P)H dehydrogenase (quinone)
MDRVIAVTGATGGLGGRVAARLAEHGVPQRLLVRDAARAPDLPRAEVVTFGGYDDPGGLRAALDGVDTLLLVSAAEHPDRVSLHRRGVDAAVAAGVAHIVYTSFQGAAPDSTFTFGRDHFHTEEHIKATGVTHTFLRDNLYLDFMPLLCGADGVIRGPAGDGRVAAVARDDIAACAVEVLTSDGHANATYDLTGAEAFTMAEAAERVGRAAGRPVTYVAETLEEARASRAPTGAPAWEIEGWVTTYSAIAAGELEQVSGDVERLIGRRPTTLDEFLRDNPDSYRHLVSA